LVGAVSLSVPVAGGYPPNGRWVNVTVSFTT